MTTTEQKIGIEQLVTIALSYAYAFEVSSTGDDCDVELSAEGLIADSIRVEGAIGVIDQFCDETGYTYRASEFGSPRDVILYFAQVVPWHLARFYRPEFGKGYNFSVSVEGSRGVKIKILMDYQRFCDHMRGLFTAKDLSRGAVPNISGNSLATRAMLHKRLTTLNYKGGVK